MRRLAVLLCAALLAVAVYVPTHQAKPAHAFGPCNPFDQAGNIYDDGYTSVFWTIHSSADGRDHQIGTDLKAWRLPWYNGFCYRAYYESIWCNDGCPGTFYPYLRTFVCGGTMADFSPGNSLGSRADVVTRGNPIGWGGPWGAITMAVTDPNNVTRLVDFGAYSDGSGCYQKEASNITTAASNLNWNSSPYAAYQGIFYLNFNVP